MITQTSPLAGLELDDQEIRSQISAMNRHRLTWVLGIFLFVHLAHIVAFWPYTPGPVTDTERWRNGIMLIHGSLAAFIAAGLPAKFLLERRYPLARTILDAIPTIAGFLYLIGGAALAIVDQWVTTSITPVLAVAVGVALAVIIRPGAALFIYVFSLVFFLIGVGWVQADPNLLLTTRVNSLSVFSFGYGLTLLQWRNHVRSLRQQHRILEQQRELEEKNRELAYLATRDALTGLLNRAQFLREVQAELDRMKPGRSLTSCLVIMDVDDFKLINDTYGHPVGDSVLVQVAERLKGMLAGAGPVGRMGGEEFAALLPGESLPDGTTTAERLCAGISEHPFVVGAHTVVVTASFGVAELLPEPEDALEQCYRKADLALYQAKNGGRNCVRS